MKKILIIDDSGEDFELLKRALLKTREDLIIEWIADSDSAIERMNKINTGSNQETLNLVVLDIKMIGADGFKILSAIKEGKTTKDISVLMLSSSHLENDISKAMDLGANSYIRKPSDFRNYKFIVDKIIEYCN